MNDHPTIVDAKKALRDRMRAVRAALSPDARRAASLRIAEIGIADLLPPATPLIIAGFMPIDEEISPLPLMQRLADAGHQLALPVMQGKAEPLLFRHYAPGDRLVTRVWGIREPDDAARAVLPDVVLTALLAFDGAGYRLGYGGGYYDRSLAFLRARKPVVAIGLAFDEQSVETVPRLAYDVRLDAILAPSGLIRPRS